MEIAIIVYLICGIICTAVVWSNSPEGMPIWYVPFITIGWPIIILIGLLRGY